MTKFPKFVLCRSDAGDGGWSLHPEGSTDNAIANGEARVLVAGNAAQDENSEWDRPNIDDYRAAVRALAE